MIAHDRVYKYPLALVDSQVVELPAYSTVVSAQIQDGQIVMWARVDTRFAACPVDVYVVGTGHPMPRSSVRFIDTVQLDGFVWHVFARGA